MTCDVCRVWGMTHPQGCQRPAPVALTPDPVQAEADHQWAAAAHTASCWATHPGRTHLQYVRDLATYDADTADARRLLTYRSGDDFAAND